MICTFQISSTKRIATQWLNYFNNDTLSKIIYHLLKKSFDLLSDLIDLLYMIYLFKSKKCITNIRYISYNVISSTMIISPAINILSKNYIEHPIFSTCFCYCWIIKNVSFILKGIQRRRGKNNL